MQIQDKGIFSSYSLSGKKLEDISIAAKIAAGIFALATLAAITATMSAVFVGEAIAGLICCGVCLVLTYDCCVVVTNVDEANMDRINRFGHIGHALVNSVFKNTPTDVSEAIILTKNTLVFNKLI